MDPRNLRAVVTGSALAVGAIQVATGALGIRRGRRDYADVVWGPGLAAVSVVGAAVGTGDLGRRLALAAGTSAWATRLASLVLGRVRGSEEEDDRYTEFLEGDSDASVALKVFGTQALAQLVVSAPIQVAAASSLPTSARRLLVPVGLTAMAGGALMEALADRQKAQYMARKARAKEEGREDEVPAVLDTGLWGWSRHPNYAGDAIFWTGVWVTAAASPPAGWTWPAPVAMGYFLVFATGAKRTERRMQDRPAYRDYQQRVSFFLPRPPRSG